MKRQTENLTGWQGLSKRFLLALTLLSALCLTACKNQQPIVQTDTIERTVTEYLRDTVVRFEADSAQIVALVECDSLRRVQIRQLAEMYGQRLKPTLKVTESASAVTLTFNCHEDSLQRIIQLRDREIHELRTSQQTVTVECEKHLTLWQSFVMTTGYIALVFILLIIVAALAKCFYGTKKH